MEDLPSPRKRRPKIKRSDSGRGSGPTKKKPADMVDPLIMKKVVDQRSFTRQEDEGVFCDCDAAYDADPSFAVFIAHILNSPTPPCSRMPVRTRVNTLATYLVGNVAIWR